MWGGYDDYLHSIGDGGLYIPATDIWKPTSAGANVPHSRAEHSAVWTGTEMILWGGYGGPSDVLYLNTGARYSPLTETWLPTSVGPGVPSQRERHSAVWTGTEMIIWGGSGLTSGGRYDPLTDTWVATSQTNAPAGRELHSAVWTGSEMIVWGGWTVPSSMKLDTGGRYSPATNTWAPTTLSNAPSARYQHAALWSGTEMIVWGGQSASTENTGRRYNPATDTWVATSLVNAPTARTAHSAVWTGQRMIVWGGIGSSGPFDNGAYYEPTGDLWSPILWTPPFGALAAGCGSNWLRWSSGVGRVVRRHAFAPAAVLRVRAGTSIATRTATDLSCDGYGLFVRRARWVR